MLRAWLDRRRKARERSAWERGAGWAMYILHNGSSEDIRECRDQVDPVFVWRKCGSYPFEDGAKAAFDMADKAWGVKWR